MQGSVIFIVVMIAIVWFLLVRPQRQRQSKQQQMLNALQVGDEVVTAGGIYGTIDALEDDLAHVRVASQVSLRVARRAIAQVVTQEPATVGEPPAEPIEGEHG